MNRNFNSDSSRIKIDIPLTDKAKWTSYVAANLNNIVKNDPPKKVRPEDNEKKNR